MRVVVATGDIGPFTSSQAGAVIARAWVHRSGHPRHGLEARPAELVVVPVGEAGSGFLTALADQLGTEVRLAATGGALTATVHAGPVIAVGQVSVGAPEPADGQVGIDQHGSSLPLGLAVRAALEASPGPAPGSVILDLAGLRCHDGGAGLLAGLGATADVPLTGGLDGLTKISRIDLAPVRALLGDADLVGVVPADQCDRALLGLRGITSLLGRTDGFDPAVLLAADATLERFARLVDADATGTTGVGAGGGTGYAVAALGGRLVGGTDYLGERVGLARSVRAADLVLTGCTVFDVATRGGGVVASIATLAGATLRPCVAVAGEVLIGTREMRTLGIEAAYPIHEDASAQTGELTIDDLAQVADRVARTWSW